MMVEARKQDKINGILLRIERASIHDGEGLRSVIFLKGCPLNCPWCSTPESRQSRIERGYIKEKCTLCLKCVENCPAPALEFDENSQDIYYNKNNCRHCFSCAKACLNNAIQRYGNEVTVDQVMNEIVKDEIFYYYSGGGVTISGGEPLTQPLFTQAILKECKKLGINTAIESCYHARPETVDLILPWLDSLYVDIKHMNDGCHLNMIGEGNSTILNNIIKTDQSEYPVKITIRIPLIKGFNDSVENLADTIRFAEDLTKVVKIELLPYHRLGISTYRYIGLKYKYPELTSQSNEEIKAVVEYLNKTSKIPITAGSGFTAE